jgi:hypothetical protein
MNDVLKHLGYRQRSGRFRRALLLASIGPTALFGALLATSARADESADNSALAVVRRWAAERGWQADVATPLKGGVDAGVMETSDEEQAVAQTCCEIARRNHFEFPGEKPFYDPKTADDLKKILDRQPDYFFAEDLLAVWHRERGEFDEADRWLKAANGHAPAILVRRFVFSDGRPLPDAAIPYIAIQYRRDGDAPDKSLKLEFRNRRTDAQGCVYLPVYDTVCRQFGPMLVPGYKVEVPPLDWFKPRGKVTLLPVVTVAEKPGDFTPRAAADAPATSHATFSDGTTVELEAIGHWPIEEGKPWWLPDGSLAADSYPVCHQSTPQPLEQGRTFHFHFGSSLGQNPGIRLQFSRPASTFCSTNNGILLQSTAEFPIPMKQVSIRIGATLAEPRVLCHYDPATQELEGELPKGCKIKRIKDRGGQSSTIGLTHPRGNEEFLAVAICADGKEETPTGTSTANLGPDLVEETYSFRAPGAQVVAFRFEARDFEWVELDNIPLHPAR